MNASAVKTLLLAAALVGAGGFALFGGPSSGPLVEGPAVSPEAPGPAQAAAGSSALASGAAGAGRHQRTPQEEASYKLRRKFRRCQLRQLRKDPEIEGRARVDLTLDEQGKPREVSVVATGGHITPPVLDCMKQMATDTQFPPPAQAGDTVTVPVRFRKVEGLPGLERVLKRKREAAEQRAAEQEVKSSLDQLRPGFRACYEKQREKQPNLRGQLGLKIRVGADGSVVQTKAKNFPGSALPAEVLDCVEALARKAVFDKPKEGSAVLQVPMSFDGEQG